MSNSTLGTLRDLDQAEFLSTSTRTHLSVSSPEIANIFSVVPPKGDGEGSRQYDWDGAQSQNADLIEVAVREVREASKAYRNTKLLLKEVARERNAGARTLRSGHRSLQKVFVGSSEEGLLLVGLDVPPSRTMLGLREQCFFVLDLLRQPTLPEKLAALGTRLGGSAPDVEALAQRMEQDLNAFEAVQARWTEAKKVRDEAYLARQDARKRLRRTVVNVARIQEGYYRLAGLDDLADRLRLTLRSTRSKKQDTADTTPPPPDTNPAVDVVDA